MQEKVKVGQMWFHVNDIKTTYVITKILKASSSITNVRCKVFKKVKDANWFNTKEDELVVFSIDYDKWRKIDF